MILSPPEIGEPHVVQLRDSHLLGEFLKIIKVAAERKEYKVTEMAGGFPSVY